MFDEFDLETILTSLIEVDTSNPPGENYNRINNIIKASLASSGCHFKLVTVPTKRVNELVKEVEGISGERVNLLASLERGIGKTIILNAHVDVVPVGEGWTHPPFELTRSDRDWYGRGVADDKGPLAALMVVFKELATNPNWRGKIILAPTIDEEIGGHTGLSYLLDAGLLEGDYCIVGDGGIESITNAANGCLRFRVTIKGSAVHSSMNWLGINAIEKATKLIKRVGKHNAVLHKIKSSIPANPQTGVNWLTPSITVGVISGGTKVNSVPSTCVMEIDRRLIPEENKSEAVVSFTNILEELKRVDVDFVYTLEIGGFHDSFITSKENEVVSTLSQTYNEILERKGHIYGSLGCLDAAYVAKHNIPVVAFGASRVESNYHGIDEHVGIDDLLDFGNIIEATVLRLLKPVEVK
jgi:succinyl-diaminopimelate desuccinylase